MAYTSKQYAPCIAGQSVLFPSLTPSQFTHQPPMPLLFKSTDHTRSPRYKMTLTLHVVWAAIKGGL